jgi:hypothetical protein
VTRRGLLLLFASPHDLNTRIEIFNTAWNKFYRRLHGCPDDATTIDECREIRGEFNVRLWREVQEKFPQ